MSYTVKSGELVLINGLFTRKIELPEVNGRYLLKEYRPATGDFPFFDLNGEEFSFLLNGVSYSGSTGWTLLSVENMNGKTGEGVFVTLLSTDQSVQVKLAYRWYSDLPIVCKSLSIQNNIGAEQYLESVDVEHFAVSEYFAPTFSWIYSDYGRRKSIGPYLGGLQDSLIIVHHPEWEAGIVLGNEAPGVLKGGSVWYRGRNITLGLTHYDERYPFRKYLAPGESFTAPDVFTGVYNGQEDTCPVMNGIVADA